MSFYVCNSLYPSSFDRSTVESIELNLRKSLYSNELSGLSSEQKKVRKQALVTNANNELNNQKINGFNKWAFLLGVIGFHTGRIFSTKVLLSEMGKAAIPHAAMAVGTGVVTGFLIGQLFSYDLGLYSRWRITRRAIDRHQNELASKH